MVNLPVGTKVWYNGTLATIVGYDITMNDCYIPLLEFDEPMAEYHSGSGRLQLFDHMGNKIPFNSKGCDRYYYVYPEDIKADISAKIKLKIKLPK